MESLEVALKGVIMEYLRGYIKCSEHKPMKVYDVYLSATTNGISFLAPVGNGTEDYLLSGVLTLNGFKVNREIPC